MLESGTTPEIDARLRAAPLLITSRLALVESSRALIRLRVTGSATEEQLADAALALDAIWSRCDIWEIDRAVCELAQSVAPSTTLRTLDALHLATFYQARRRLGALELLTADEKMRAAAAIPDMPLARVAPPD